MKNLLYVYENKLNAKDPQKEDFFEDERVLSKTEDIKLEDNLANVVYEAKCYITNIRIIVLSNKFIFDVPLCLVKSHYVKKPMLYGSSYIYVDFYEVNLKSSIPPYFLRYLSSDNSINYNYNLPKYIMLKFRGKDSNIDQSYEILKIALNSKEWNNALKIEEKKKVDEAGTKSQTVSGIGLERTRNIIMTQISEQNNMISGSFSDIQNLKENASQMIELSQQLKSKLTSTMKNDPTMNEINQVLTSVGFIDPVTKETSGKSYFMDLALQISEYFTSYFKREEIGILSLIDAYCIYNRSRGINTISPGDMKIALNYFPQIETPIQIKSFKNEMIMLHTDDYCLENLINKLKTVLSENKEFVTLKEFSDLTTKKNQLLSKILIEEMLDEGLMVIDESDLDLRYYMNKILNYKN